MDILLTHGYFLESDRRERSIMKPYPPLGLLSLSAFLKEQGFDARVFDSTFRTMGDFLEQLDVHRPPVVGLYCNLMTKLTVLEMVRHCKSRGHTVILGGPEPPSYAEEFLNHGADVIVIGEGERTLTELLERLPVMGSRNLHEVSGIAFKDDTGSVRRTSPRELIHNLDELPFPDRESIDLQHYIDVWRLRHGRGSVSLVTARGCPYTCTWCSHGVYGFTHRRRTPQNVVREIEFLIDRYRPDMMWIADDVFTINHRWIAEFSTAMAQRGLKLPFECISRADRLTEEVIALLAQSGCFRLWIGSESGSQRILDAMARGVTVEEIRSATRLAQRRGIEVGLFVMLGYDGETVADIEATIDHLKRTGADLFLTTVAYPIKGTVYYEAVASRIHSPLPWSNRTERDLDVRGRHTKAFYWFAQRRMTNEVKLHKRSGNGRLRPLERAAAWSKATVARWGMKLTKDGKS